MFGIFGRLKRRFALRQMADFFQRVDRNPVTRTPGEVGLEFEEVSFKSLDGLDLSGWYLPALGSEKLVVFNHFMLGNKAGAVPHKDWGNISVDFMPIYRHLVDAGYSVLTFDLRNHGASGVWEGGKLGLTNVEYQDSVASVRYAKKRFPGSKIHLFSQCYGAVSTIRGMDRHPEDFVGVGAFVCLQPLTPEGFVTGVMEKFDMASDDNLPYFGERLKKKTGYGLDELEVPSGAVEVPTLLVQVQNDWRTTPKSIEEIYENLAADDKKLLWIENEEERLQGYNYFAKHPEEMIAWLDSH